MLAELALAFSMLAQSPSSAPARAPSPEAEKVEWQAQTICPVSQEPLKDKKEHFVDFEGQRIYVCYKECIKPAAEAPELMIAALARVGQAPESIHTHCPVADEELEGREHVVWVGNKSFAVCCKKCARKAAGTPALFLDKLEGRGKQMLCPISGGKIDRRQFVDLEGFRVHGCSKECLQKIQADPAAAFAKLASQKVILEPRASTCHLNPKEKRDKKVFVTVGAKRHYFCCVTCQGKWLAKQVTPKAAREATGGALDFLGGSLGGGSR